MQSYWRTKAREIITDVLNKQKGAPESEIRKALHNAYPFGPRKYHPYKIWLDEIALQRGKKKRNTFGRKKKAIPTDPNQERMF